MKSSRTHPCCRCLRLGLRASQLVLIKVWGRVAEFVARIGRGRVKIEKLANVRVNDRDTDLAGSARPPRAPRCHDRAMVDIEEARRPYCNAVCAMSAET